MSLQNYVHHQQALRFPERSASFQGSLIDSPINPTIPYLEGIHKCPVEVLTEIFMGCLEDKTCQIDHLLFVCRQWYLLIIHTPRFWTRITILITSPIRSVAAPRLCFVETFIQRSKGMLLNIEVKCSWVKIVRHTADWQNYCPAFNRLGENIYRCQTLHVALPWDLSLSGIVCSLFKGPAPNMVKLSIGNLGYLRQVATFSELPNLRILEIDGYPFGEMVHSHSSFPLAQLHSLDLNIYGFSTWARNKWITWTSDVSLLRCLRSLQIRYKLNNTAGIHPKDSIRDPISLPLLENLGLWGLDQLELQFELPALRSLSLDGVHFPNTDPTEVIWRPERGILAIHGDLIKSIILQYRSSKRFVLPDWTEEALVSALRVMKGEGSVPDSSVSFIKESVDGIRNPMEI